MARRPGPSRPQPNRTKQNQGNEEGKSKPEEGKSKPQGRKIQTRGKENPSFFLPRSQAFQGVTEVFPKTCNSQGGTQRRRQCRFPLILSRDAKHRASKDGPEGGGVRALWSVLRDASPPATLLRTRVVGSYKNVTAKQGSVGCFRGKGRSVIAS